MEDLTPAGALAAHLREVCHDRPADMIAATLRAGAALTAPHAPDLAAFLTEAAEAADPPEHR